MAKTIGTDVATYRQAVAFEMLSYGQPEIPELSEREIRELLEGDTAARAKLASHLIKRELWEQNAPTPYLHENSYGFAIKHKSRERLYKLAALELLAQQAEGSARTASDAELVAMLEATSLPAVGEHGQDADSADSALIFRTVP